METKLYIQKNCGNHRRFVQVEIGDDIVNMLKNGLDPIEDKPQLGLFLMTTFTDEDGKNSYYPVRMLYRSHGERVLNSLIHNRSLPPPAQVEAMQSHIETLCGNEVDWYLKPATSVEALTAMVIDIEEHQKPQYLNHVLENLGVLLHMRDLSPVDGQGRVKYLSMALEHAEYILKSLGKDTSLLTLSDFL